MQMPSHSILEFLETPYVLRQEQIDFYQKNSFPPTMRKGQCTIVYNSV